MRWGALAMAVVCLGCGGGDDDGSGAADAAAGGDGAVVDAAGAGADAAAVPNAVIVRVLADGVGVPGITAVLQSSGGAVVAEQVTDRAGEATFEDPPAGAMVTALLQAENAPHLSAQTVVGVEPGDVIVIGAPAAPEDPTADVRMHYPGAFTGADLYLSYLGCDAFGQVNPDSVITRAVGTSCLGSDDDYDVLAVARQGTTALAYAAVRDVPTDADGTTDITLPAWVAAETRELSFDNLSGEVTDTAIDLRAVLDGLTRWPALAAGDVYTVPPAGLVDGWYVRATVRAFAGPDARIWAWRQVLAPGTPSPYALDFADFGPRFDTLDLDVADVVRPALGWTSSATTSDLGAVVLVVTWTDLETAPDTSHRWTVVLPPGSESAVFPALPDDAAAFRPSATADYQLLQVFGFWYARQPDYAAFRNEQPFALGSGFVDGRAEEARMLLYQKDVAN